MPENELTNPPNESEIVIYTTKDGLVKLEVRL